MCVIKRGRDEQDVDFITRSNCEFGIPEGAAEEGPPLVHSTSLRCGS